MTKSEQKDFERGFLMACREYGADESAEHIEKLAEAISGRYLGGSICALTALTGAPGEAEQIMSTIGIPFQTRSWLLQRALDS
jgi:hypothetical protein